MLLDTCLGGVDYSSEKAMHPTPVFLPGKSHGQRKPLVLYDVDRGVVMEPMQGKLASSQFDLGTPSNFAFLG